MRRIWEVKIILTAFSPLFSEFRQCSFAFLLLIILMKRQEGHPTNRLFSRKLTKERKKKGKLFETIGTRKAHEALKVKGKRDYEEGGGRRGRRKGTDYMTDKVE
jgi:hypothetical protein